MRMHGIGRARIILITMVVVLAGGAGLAAVSCILSSDDSSVSNPMTIDAGLRRNYTAWIGRTLTVRGAYTRAMNFMSCAGGASDSKYVEPTIHGLGLFPTPLPTLCGLPPGGVPDTLYLSPGPKRVETPPIPLTVLWSGGNRPASLEPFPGVAWFAHLPIVGSIVPRCWVQPTSIYRISIIGFACRHPSLPCAWAVSK